MKIIIKEIDRLLSSHNKGEYLSEYLIYLNFDDISIECYNEIGSKSKELKVNELTKKYNCNRIEEITFEEFKKTI